MWKGWTMIACLGSSFEVRKAQSREVQIEVLRYSQEKYDEVEYGQKHLAKEAEKQRRLEMYVQTKVKTVIVALTDCYDDDS